MKTYDVAQQTQYPNTAYRTKDGKPAGATIKSGGCGPSSVRNLGNNLLSWNTTIPEVAQLAVDCGARYDGGTTIATLLKACQERYGAFEYEYTESDKNAREAVRDGAMAIIHTKGAVGGTYNKLLSNSGHFLCLAAVEGDTATIIDSYAYSGKWTQNSVRKKYIKTTGQQGVVQCSTAALAAAVDYYYIVTKPVKKTAPKEDDEVVAATKHNINGTEMTLNAITKDGTTYVAERALCSALGLTIDYDNETGTRSITPDKIKLSVDGSEVEVDGNIMTPGTTMAAVRPLAEALGYTVGWDGDNKIVTLTKA